jgi:hypothetical protein
VLILFEIRRRANLADVVVQAADPREQRIGSDSRRGGICKYADVHGVLKRAGRRGRQLPQERMLIAESILATALWIVASVAFKFYVSRFAAYTVTYGALGGAVVTMLWFYVSSLAILIGAELNAVIEKAWRPENANDH